MSSFGALILELNNLCFIQFLLCESLILPLDIKITQDAAIGIIVSITVTQGSICYTSSFTNEI